MVFKLKKLPVFNKSSRNEPKNLSNKYYFESFMELIKFALIVTEDCRLGAVLSFV